MIWLFLELRRLFQGAQLDVDRLGYHETAAYAVAGLAVAALLWKAGTLLGERLGVAGEGLSRTQATIGGAAAAVALWLLAYQASPWWGPLQGPVGGPSGAALLLALYAAAVALGALLARVWRPKALLLSRIFSAAVVELFAALTLLIRYLYRGSEMRAALREASLETWTFSALWAVYGVGVLALGARRRDPALRWIGLLLLLSTTAKVFLFDMARLEGVVRAASFLALGALLVAGALLARRLARDDAAASQGEAAADPLTKPEA